jgi:D-ribose pyranose/furanose isomerase RbsD
MKMLIRHAHIVSPDVEIEGASLLLENDRIAAVFGANVPVDVVPLKDFRQRSRTVKAVIRTGDFTAYSNVLLVSAGGPRWYLERP